MNLRPLAALRRNEEAVIHRDSDGGPLDARLRELGLLPGARVRMIASGSPCILLVAGSTRLCLRGDEADSIMVVAS
jgi:Fe2+ transport system protein FeoA